jgi:ATP-dependent Clp protease adaptor protein ClpS
MSDILKRIFGNNTPEQDNGNGGDTAVIERPPELAPVDEEKTAKPPMYAVILHNDNSTSFYFVVDVLREVFAMEGQRAQQIMMAAHNNGQAVVAIYSKEVAETKLEQTTAKIAKDGNGQNGRNPQAPCELRFSIEEESKGE